MAAQVARSFGEGAIVGHERRHPRPLSNQIDQRVISAERTGVTNFETRSNLLYAAAVGCRMAVKHHDASDVPRDRGGESRQQTTQRARAGIARSAVKQIIAVDQQHFDRGKR